MFLSPAKPTCHIQYSLDSTFATSSFTLKPISFSVVFWHLPRHLTGIQPTSIPWSHPAPRAWVVKGSNTDSPAPAKTLTTSQGKGTSFDQLMVTTSYIVCWMKPTA